MKPLSRWRKNKYGGESRYIRTLHIFIDVTRSAKRKPPYQWEIEFGDGSDACGPAETLQEAKDAADHFVVRQVASIQAAYLKELLEK